MSKNTKKLAPKVRFPEFRDTEAWELRKLGDVSQIVRGGSPRPIDDYITSDINGLNWLKIADVDKESKYVTSTKEKVHSSALSKTREVNPGDLIMSNSMSFGRPYILKIKSCIHDGWIAVTKIDGKTSRDYLYYLILSPKSQEYFVDNAAGGGVQNLNADIIKLLKVPIPKLLEQQKIADCLSSIDDLITAQSQKVEALKTHKKGLMQQLFPREGETIPRFRFPEFRDAGEWELKLLGSVGINLDSKRIPITESDRVKGGIPYYGASGIIDYVKDYIFDDELLCISEDGANLIARVYPIAFPITGKTWVNNHAHVLKFDFRPTQVIVENYLNSINLEDYLTGMAQPKLNRAKLDIIPIPLPEPNEQHKIADCLSSIDDLITTQTQKLEALRTHKKGLMQQLFPSSNEQMDLNHG